jgi:hypothetical protein
MQCSLQKLTECSEKCTLSILRAEEYAKQTRQMQIGSNVNLLAAYIWLVVCLPYSFESEDGDSIFLQNIS